MLASLTEKFTIRKKALTSGAKSIGMRRGDFDSRVSIDPASIPITKQNSYE